ncbi:unnamed protein product, partial [Anisakis simplex]|uniref:Cysteine rich repeat-containing domain protein n=1 Tax=Anisakis simplex TaxID=6269 RepID=A0A0M3IZB3_ANISI
MPTSNFYSQFQLPQLCRCNPTMPCPCAGPQSDPLAQCMPICQRSCSSSCLQQNLPLEECQSTCAITCQQACSKYQRLSGLINGQASNVQALQSRSVQSICAPKCQQTCLAVCFGRNYPRAKCEQTCQRTCAEVCSKQPNLVLSASEAEVFSGAPQVSQASPPIQESLIAPQKQCVPACMPACLPECTGEIERRSTVITENPPVLSVSGQLTSASADSAQNQRCVDQCFSTCIDVCVQARQPLHGCLSGCSAECGNKCGVQLSGSSPQQQITRPEVIFQMPEVGQLEPRQQIPAVQQTQYQYQPEVT